MEETHDNRRDDGPLFSGWGLETWKAICYKLKQVHLLQSPKDLFSLHLTCILKIWRETTKINPVFVFFTLFISLTQISKQNKYNGNCFKFCKAVSEVRARRRY